MNLNLSGKKALITGSTAGIGFTIAKTLLEEGASVVVNGRSSARVQDAVKRLAVAAAAANRVEGIDADISTPEGINRLRKSYPDFDIVINNLGIYEAKELDAIVV